MPLQVKHGGGHSGYATVSMPVAYQIHHEGIAYREQCEIFGCLNHSHAIMGILDKGHIVCFEFCEDHLNILLAKMGNLPRAS